jgi:hypothetical protein
MNNRKEGFQARVKAAIRALSINDHTRIKHRFPISAVASGIIKAAITSVKEMAS